MFNLGLKNELASLGPSLKPILMAKGVWFGFVTIYKSLQFSA